MDAHVDAHGSGAAVSDRRDAAQVRYAYFDGLRGWAAVAVLIFHSTKELFGRAHPAFGDYKLLLNDGFLAVAVFFVLSGFVLSRPHLPVPNLDRVRRIAFGRYVRLTIPIVVASLLAWALMVSGAIFSPEAAQIGIGREAWLDRFYRFDPSLWDCLRFAFYDVYFNYDYGRSYDIVLWTMPWELAGSFLIFAIVLLLGDGGWKLVLCIPLVVLLMLNNSFLPCFVYGYLLAHLHVFLEAKPIAKGAAGNVVGLSLVLAVALYRQDHGGLRTEGVLAAGLVLAPLLSPFLRRLLSCPLSRWLGRLSFPLYLVHVLVICSVSSFMIVRLHELSWPPASIALVVIPVTLVTSLAATQIFAPVERLAVRSSHRLGTWLLNITATPGRVSASLPASDR